MKYDENELQKIVVNRLRAAGYIVIHVANERQMGVAEARRMQSLGVVKGAPDLICWGTGGQCWWLELKAAGRKRTIEQVCFEKTASNFGIGYKLVRTLKDVDDLCE
jgi:hypothetical protein